MEETEKMDTSVPAVEPKGDMETASTPSQSSSREDYHEYSTPLTVADLTSTVREGTQQEAPKITKCSDIVFYILLGELKY